MNAIVRINPQLKIVPSKIYALFIPSLISLHGNTVWLKLGNDCGYGKLTKVRVWLRLGNQDSLYLSNIL